MQGQNTLLSPTISIFGSGGGQTIWYPKSYTFVADSGTTTLTFKDVSPATDALDLLLDHVRVTPQGGTKPASILTRFPGNSNAARLQGTISLAPLAEGFRISLSNVPTGPYELQRSTDLTSWTAIVRMKASDLGTAQFDDLDPVQEMSFYRVVPVELAPME